MTMQFKMNTPAVFKGQVFQRLYIETALDNVMIDAYNVKAGFRESEPDRFDEDFLMVELEGTNCILRVAIELDTIQHVEFNDRVGIEEFIIALWEGC